MVAASEGVIVPPYLLLGGLCSRSRRRLSGRGCLDRSSSVSPLCNWASILRQEHNCNRSLLLVCQIRFLHSVQLFLHLLPAAPPRVIARDRRICIHTGRFIAIAFRDGPTCTSHASSKALHCSRTSAICHTSHTW